MELLPQSIARKLPPLGSTEQQGLKALALDKQLGNPLGQANDLNNIGLVYADQGELEEALGSHQEALALDKQLGNPLGQAIALGNIGNVYYNQGELEDGMDSPFGSQCDYIKENEMSHTKKGDRTMQVERIGLDIAKSSFQVHGVDAHGKVGVRKQLSRSKVLLYFAQLPPCLIGLEACGGAHYWARELQKLGHEVRLMAVAMIQPYRTGQKNDQNDAEAICEAVSRPRTRFVPVKSEAQQAVLTVHRARELLVTERTALANQIRGLLMEYGVVIAQGIQRLRRELPGLLAATETLPELVRDVVEELRERMQELDRRITDYDHRIEQLAKQNEATRRLMQVEGVGPITATAIVATIGNGHAFQHGRQFAAWVGLVPKQHSTGGKTVLGRITKHGNVYLRTLLIHGARAVLQFSAKRSDQKSRWVEQVRQRRGNNIAAVALAAKHARILWALLAHGQEYQLAA